MKNFTSSIYTYSRRIASEVRIGHKTIGGLNPICIETMTNTDVLDVKSTVSQCIQLYKAGCEIIRIATPSIKGAEALAPISKALSREGLKISLVADIHFTPNAALKAVEYAENIRINPGNYADKKKFLAKTYSNEEYSKELDRIHHVFKPFVLKCKTYGKSIRIGCNHGSLSDRIMNRYGDTPLGMVESALEFARICIAYNFHDIIFSMKSSITQVMIYTCRLLVSKLKEEGLRPYPLHLGVTEAGNGDAARIKSSIGIGSLLEDGIGDTIRVSLTEDPVREIPVCKYIVKKYNARLEQSKRNIHYKDHLSSSKLNNQEEKYYPFDPYHYRRWPSQEIILGNIPLGNNHVPRVEIFRKLYPKKQSLPDSPKDMKAEIISYKISSEKDIQDAMNATKSAISLETNSVRLATLAIKKYKSSSCKIRLLIKDQKDLDSSINSLHLIPTYTPLELCVVKSEMKKRDAPQALLEMAKRCKELALKNILLSIKGHDIVHDYRRLWRDLQKEKVEYPVAAYYYNLDSMADSEKKVHASIQLGSLLIDGLIDSILIDNLFKDEESTLQLAYNILQGSRRRVVKTEFISCPSCGRTLFDLESVTEKIQNRTSHLKELKIAIMGCIVNGPGEMADADFGYVGTGIGKVSLYVEKKCVKRDIPQEEALDNLVDIIKKHGKWRDPS